MNKNTKAHTKAHTKANMRHDTATDDNMRTHNVRRIGVAVAVFLLAVILFASASKWARHPDNSPSVEPSLRADYLHILGETHTGYRLARLQDFTAQHPNTRYQDAVRVQIQALRIHEAKAWARLTQALYNVDPASELKQEAFTRYTQQWSTLVRPQKLSEIRDRLTNITRTASRMPKDPSSFPLKTQRAKKRAVLNAYNQNILAGGRDIGGELSRFAPTITSQIYARPNRNIRVRKAARPKYPKHAYKYRIPARVTLSLDIDQEGNVMRTQLVSVEASRYSKKFIKASKRAARRSNFYPRLKNGQPIVTHGFVRTYTFRPQ
jgi:TonB family protein